MSEREAERTTNDLLAGQISRTEREIKRVDLFAMTAQLAACSVAILFFGILTDHYVFRAGMSTAGRLGFFLALCTACLVIVLRRAVPLLRRRVNPRYAAKVLEGPQGNRTNAIINWLDLCLRHEEASVPDSPLRRKVLDQVAYQAAVEVRELPDETIVDHSSVIRWTIIFACMMGLFLVYTLFASKSPVRSLRRILCPTASIAAPQEVRFLRISPGNVTLFPDSKLQVEAEIAGVGSREVAFCYSTRDARLVDQTVPMTHVGGNIWSLEFPSSSGALLEPLDYEIIVGRQGRKDNRSATFQLNVRSAITFATEKVVVVPPAYTGREAEVHEDSGDIRALYGSQVTLRARANTPLAKALFLPGKQENRAKVMTLDPEQPSLATFEFSVVWDVNNRIGNEPVFPGMDSYQLTCSDAEGNRNRNDATGRVEILRDEAPIVEWVRAAEGVADVPVNQKLGFSVLAVDPDFGLANVTGHILLREEQGVVSAPQPEITFPLLPLTPPHAGALVSITGEQTLNGAILPDSLQLVVGQHYEYWVTASDNALPEPNTAQTGKKLFRVLPPDENPTETPPDEATPTEKDGDEKGGDEKGGDEKGEAGQEKGSETSGDGSDAGESDAGEDGQSSEGKDTGEDGQTQEGQPSEEESEGFASSQNAAGEGSEGEPSSGQQESGAGEESASEGASTSESSSQPGQSGQEGQSGQKGKSEPTEQSTSGPGEPSNEGGQSSADKSETPAEPGDTQNSDGGLGSESDGDALNDGDASQGQGQPGQGQPGQETDNEADNEAGEGTDGKAGQTPGSEPTDPTSEPTSGDGPNASDNDSPPAIDPETNPGDAFEKILEHRTRDLQEEKGEGSGFVRDPSAQGEKQPLDELDYPLELPEGLEQRQGELTQKNHYMTQNTTETQAEHAAQAGNDVQVTDNPNGAQGVSTTEHAPETPTATGPDASGKEPGTPGEPASQEDQGQGQPTPGQNDARGGNSEPNMPVPGPTSGGANQAGGKESESETPGPAPADATPNAPPNATPESGDPNGQSGTDAPGKANSPNEHQQSVGGGHEGSGTFQESGSLAPPDSPNLAYTQQATELALEYLEEQIKEGIDRELLDDLGWSEEQMRTFLEKWKKMEQKAKKPDASQQDRVEYLESLRNIGLRRPSEGGPVQAQEGLDDDKFGRKNEESRRSAPPPALRDRFRAYNKGVSRSR